MKYPEFSVLLRIILLSSSMLVLGLYFLAKFNSLFTRAIKIEWLRKNIVVWLIAICLGLAISPTKGDFFEASKMDRPPMRGAQTPEEVVDAALRGMGRKKSFVISGWANLFMVETERIVPRSLVTRVAGKALRPRFED